MANLFTKENIKARMFKQAAALYNIRNLDSIDPLIKLLIEALSGEIFKLSGDMHTIESRLLEKVASALAPHPALVARPAHAIAVAQSYSAQVVVSPTNLFSYKSPEIVKKYKMKNLYFTPLHETRLINAELKYLVTADEFCTITPEGERDAIARLRSGVSGLARKISIGIKIGDNITILNDLSLYIDMPLVPDKSSYLKLLPYCRCTVGGIPIEIKGGIEYNPAHSINEKYDLTRLITEEITGKYAPHYVTLKIPGLKVGDLSRSRVPEDVSSLLPDDFISGCDADTLWIDIEFPTAFSKEILDQIKVQMNTFIVVNRYPAKISRKVDSVSAIIPLEKTGFEYFLSVDSVTGNQGEQLQEISAAQDKDTVGCYSVRRGGCERFNAMDAKDYLNRLTDLLYDESIAFSSTDKDGMKETIEQLEERIDSLGDKNKGGAEGQEMLSYVVIDQRYDTDTRLAVNYTLTNGEFANNIYAGEPLNDCANIDIDKSMLRFVTSTQGGKPSPSVKHRMDMYRFMLLSHGSIYTKEDIRNFCMARYGDSLRSVEVKLGYMTGKKESEGFIRTLDVYLGLSEGMQEFDKEEFVVDIESELRRLSPETYNYRVFINS